MHPKPRHCPDHWILTRDGEPPAQLVVLSNCGATASISAFGRQKFFIHKMFRDYIERALLAKWRQRILDQAPVVNEAKKYVADSIKSEYIEHVAFKDLQQITTPFDQLPTNGESRQRLLTLLHRALHIADSGRLLRTQETRGIPADPSQLSGGNLLARMYFHERGKQLYQEIYELNQQTETLAPHRAERELGELLSRIAARPYNRIGSAEDNNIANTFRADTQARHYHDLLCVQEDVFQTLTANRIMLCKLESVLEIFHPHGDHPLSAELLELAKKLRQTDDAYYHKLIQLEVLIKANLRFVPAPGITHELEVEMLTIYTEYTAIVDRLNQLVRSDTTLPAQYLQGINLLSLHSDRSRAEYQMIELWAKIIAAVFIGGAICLPFAIPLFTGMFSAVAPVISLELGINYPNLLATMALTYFVNLFGTVSLFNSAKDRGKRFTRHVTLLLSLTTLLEATIMVLIPLVVTFHKYGLNTPMTPALLESIAANRNQDVVLMWKLELCTKLVMPLVYLYHICSGYQFTLSSLQTWQACFFIARAYILSIAALLVLGGVLMFCYRSPATWLLFSKSLAKAASQTPMPAGELPHQPPRPLLPASSW